VNRKDVTQVDLGDVLPMLYLFQRFVASTVLKCFTCFQTMLQLF
jgi:hypothetical protein